MATVPINKDRDNVDFATVYVMFILYFTSSFVLHLEDVIFNYNLSLGVITHSLTNEIPAS